MILTRIVGVEDVHADHLTHHPAMAITILFWSFRVESKTDSFPIVGM